MRRLRVQGLPVGSLRGVELARDHELVERGEALRLRKRRVEGVDPGLKRFEPLLVVGEPHLVDPDRLPDVSGSRLLLDDLGERVRGILGSLRPVQRDDDLDENAVRVLGGRLAIGRDGVRRHMSAKLPDAHSRLGRRIPERRLGSGKRLDRGRAREVREDRRVPTRREGLPAGDQRGRRVGAAGAARASTARRRARRSRGLPGRSRRGSAAPGTSSAGRYRAPPRDRRPAC